MEANESLLKKTIIYSIGSLGSKLIVFTLVPLYSFYLSAVDLGKYDLLLTSTNVLVPIFTLQISDSAYRWLLDYNDKSKQIKKIISNSAVLVLALAFVLCMISMFILKPLKIEYLLQLTLLTISSSFLLYSQQVLRGLNKNIQYSISGLINATLVLVLSVTVLATSKSTLVDLLYATIIANALTIAYISYQVKLFKNTSYKYFSLELMIDMVRYSWPMIPNAISWWLITAANRYAILIYLGIELNGIFAIANRFPSILLILNSVFTLAWQDHVISSKDKKDTNHSKTYNNMICLEFTLVICLIAISKIMLQVLVDEKFIDAWKYMIPLYIGAKFSSLSSFFGAGYMGTKKTKGIFVSTMAGGTINVLFTLMFINTIGLYAPAIGTMLGFLCVWIIRYYQTKDFFKLETDSNILYTLFTLLLTITLATYLNNRYLNLSLIILSIIIFLKINKNILSAIGSKVKLSINKR